MQLRLVKNVSFGTDQDRELTTVNLKSLGRQPWAFSFHGGLDSRDKVPLLSVINTVLSGPLRRQFVGRK
jgi:hypothetical protein